MAKNLIWTNVPELAYPDMDENIQNYCMINNIMDNEVTDMEISRYIGECIDDGWEDMMREIAYSERRGKKFYVIEAELGLWNGRASGGMVIQGLAVALRKMLEEITSVYHDDGQLLVQAIHHDGTNVYRIKELTDAGEGYYNRHSEDDRRTLVEALYNNDKYSRNVKLLSNW